MKPEKYLITAALPYANGPLHIGHIAGCYLPSDIYVRYLKLGKNDVKFVCGSDEHGVPITIKAKKEGITPQEVVNRYHELMKQAFVDFGIEFDVYARTTSKVHHQTASDFFKKLYDKGVFQEEETEQYFDNEVQQFLADRYITGTCPKCSYPSAYGDQCENCGTSLNPTDLINPKSVLSGSTPILKKTVNWFLPLDKMQPEIENYVESKKGIWKTHVYGQVRSWLNQGLQPRAMTRDLDWGVKVPLPNAEGKVLYVWFDAPIGYISATKELTENWADYWQNQDTKLVHFIGKDNIVFHCIIFPAMLMAHGDFILPENVPANEFLNLEGDKISTSRNWAVWLHEYLEEFPQKQDELRYVLTSIAPETGDSEFTWKDYQARVNNELVAILGNFVNRVVVLVNKYYKGEIGNSENLKFSDISIHQAVKETYDKLAESCGKYKFRQGLTEVMDLARFGNKYLTDKEPWKTFKIDEAATKIVLLDCLQLIAHLARCMQPYLPFTAKKIFAMLNLKKQYLWDEEIVFSPNHKINPAILLFSKIEDTDVKKQIEKLKKPEFSKTSPTHKPIAEEIQYDDFAKLDLRTATILNAEKVEKADKLLKIRLSLGFEERTVVSGIAQHFSPEEIIGKKVLYLANLVPRKLRGIESSGMILLAEDAGGKLIFMTPEIDLPDGSVVK